MARCTPIGILTGAGGSLDSPCPPLPPPPPPMLVFDFGADGTGGSHSGSLTDAATNPNGWLDNGDFFPLMRSEKSLDDSLICAPGEPNKPISTTTYSSLERGPCGVGTECPLNSAAIVIVPA